jgi:DNA repair exonuclease SbcCD ATPase subunit
VFDRHKSSRTLGEHDIFGDEEAAQLRHQLDELRTEVRELASQLHAQFTTIAAHAEIAREHSELARAEARADLERTRETLIELIETVRVEAANAGGYHVPGSRPGWSAEVTAERITAVEETLAAADAAVERCFRRQNELADTMAAFIDMMMADQRNEPVAGLSLS